MTLNLHKAVINKRAYAKQKKNFVNFLRENKTKKQTKKHFANLNINVIAINKKFS